MRSQSPRSNERLLSRKTGFIAAFALWTFALGVLLANVELLAATIPVAIYLAIVALDPAPGLDVTVTRVMPSGQTYEGEDVTVLLRVENMGATVRLEGDDALPAPVEVSRGSSHVFATLGPGESREFAYTLRPRLFGAYRLGPIRVRAANRTSTLYDERVLESYSDLRVYPAVRYMSRVEVRHIRPRNWPGEAPTRWAGQGLEFYGIKEYTQGDPPRRLNWKASARSSRLMLNQYMNESGGEIVVVVDFRSSSTAIGTQPDTVGAHAVRAAATLSYRLLRDRNRVGLVGVGRRLVRVQPAFGRRQFDRILAALISMAPSIDDQSLEVVPYYLSLHYSRMIQVVLVSPLNDPAPSYLVSNLARRGYGVLVVSPSPVGVDVPRHGDEETRRLAKELALLDRTRKISSLQRHAMVVDWNPRFPLEDALEALKERWMARRPV